MLHRGSDQHVGPPHASRFYRALPLLVGAVALFLAGIATWLVGFTAGPPDFPLWSWFLVAGSIATIGAVLLGFRTVDSRPPRPPVHSPVESRQREPRRSVELVGTRPEPRELPRHRSGQTPRTLAAWNEGTESRPLPAAATTVAPTPTGETEFVLDEIDQIQSELTPRRKGTGDRRARESDAPSGSPRRGT